MLRSYSRGDYINSSGEYSKRSSCGKRYFTKLYNPKRLIAHAKQCIQPGLEYFNLQLNTRLKIPLMAFKASQLTNPTMTKNLNLDASSVDLLKSFPFLSAEEICNLQAELPACLAKADDLDDTIDKLS